MADATGGQASPKARFSALRRALIRGTRSSRTDTVLVLSITVFSVLAVNQFPHPMSLISPHEPGWWEDDPFFTTPHVIAHRGDMGGHPENTMEAFDFAYDSGAKMIELDVRFTSDGVPICFHDETFERTTDGEGKVSEKPWNGYAENLDAGAYLSSEFSGYRIPTINETFSWLAERPDLVLWVHLRFQAGDAVLSRTIQDYRVESQVIIQVYAGEYSRFDYYQECLGRAVIIKESFLPIVVYNLDLCRHHEVQFMTIPDSMASNTLFDLTNSHGIRVMLTRNFNTTADHITQRFSMGAWGFIVNSATLAGDLSYLGEPPTASGP